MSTATLPASSERRIAPRFQPCFGTICRFAGAPEERPIIGLVWNISESGVSMLMSDPPETGAKLSAELTKEISGKGMPISLRVVHVRPMQTGDFFLGARFERPLDMDEIRPFLGHDGGAKPGRRV
jgi:PilZ domain